MATLNKIPDRIANQLPADVRKWFEEVLRPTLSETDSEIAALDSNKSDRPESPINGNLPTLDESGDLVDSGITPDDKSDTDHNHNLADLTEKSYNSLDDLPVAAAASDGTTASGVTVVACASGTDSVDRTTLNTDLAAMVAEINSINSALSTLVTNFNGLIDNLQDAGLMGT